MHCWLVILASGYLFKKSGGTLVYDINLEEKMKKLAVLLNSLLLAVGFSGAVQAQEGMTILPSSHDVAATMDKLETIVKSKGMTVMARVNHAANAEKNDMELRPTQLLIFGNPKVGTPLMKCSQSIAIDLPQKMLVWEDADGKVFLAFNDPAYLKARHATEGCDEVFDKVSGALNNFANAATAP